MGHLTLHACCCPASLKQHPNPQKIPLQRVGASEGAAWIFSENFPQAAQETMVGGVTVGLFRLVCAKSFVMEEGRSVTGL
jgi:hypothetical protein